MFITLFVLFGYSDGRGGTVRTAKKACPIPKAVLILSEFEPATVVPTGTLHIYKETSCSASSNTHVVISNLISISYFIFKN